uniref:Uncharacterized protein n=1 Tax=Pseudo-nitzschia australis TaxID=44445 RepID=A0A7S4EN12_9STRA
MITPRRDVHWSYLSISRIRGDAFQTDLVFVYYLDPWCSLLRDKYAVFFCLLLKSTVTGMQKKRNSAMCYDVRWSYLSISRIRGDSVMSSKRTWRDDFFCVSLC